MVLEKVVPSGKMQFSEFLEGTGVDTVLLAGRPPDGELQALQVRQDGCDKLAFAIQRIYMGGNSAYSFPG